MHIITNYIIIVNNSQKKEIIHIRKNNPKYKLWLKRRNNKLGRKKAKNHSRKGCSCCSGPDTNVIKHVSRPTRKNDLEKVIVKAPSNLSLINNTEEVTAFFDEVKNYIISSQNKRINVYFDLAEVKELTIDAIMYLLAIIKNLQKYGLTKHSFRGNFPNDNKAKEVIIESGFLEYVESSMPKINKNTNKIAIRTGQSNDNNILKEICDFIIKKTGCTIIATKTLYVMLAEMMFNTFEHAYNEDSKTIKNWYIFVEYESSKVKITFMDTGLGIPRTMRRRFKEKILSVPEDKLLVSALNGGEFRSQTKLEYRNNGLPTIRQCVEKHVIENLHILSNKAVCSLYYEDNAIGYKTNEQLKAIMGTIYYWEIPLSILKGVMK